MRILIDIGHPGHVHLFKHFAHEMIKRGNAVHFTVRQKEFEIELLRHEGFSFTNYGKHFKSKPGKIFGLIKFTLLTIKTSLKFRPDYYLSHGSIYNALAAFCLRKTNIALEDTGNEEQVRIYRPFTKYILTSDFFHADYGKKQVRYASFHELAYLSPEWFTPDPSIYSRLGLTVAQPFAILRFISWSASHDTKNAGITDQQKIKLVKDLSQHMNVFISSEKALIKELEPYRIQIKPYDLHHALYYAAMHIGEGGTTANECSVLGTPCILINYQAKYINLHKLLQDKYHLQNYFDNIPEAASLITQFATDKSIKKQCRERAAKLVKEKIDLNTYLIDFFYKLDNR